MKRHSERVLNEMACLRNITRVCYVVLLVLSFFVSGKAFANEGIFTVPGLFKIEKPCKGYTSKNSLSGAVDLQVNRTFEALSENSRVNGSHVRLIVDAKHKWVELTCGNYVGERPPFRNQQNSQPEPNDDCLKFFDDENNPVPVGFGGNVDITPSAPVIERFGAEVNTICGEPGKKTSRNEFIQLMKRHPDVLADLIKFTGGKVFANRPAQQDPEVYLEQLTQAWYSLGAFDHIFCGEPKAFGNIGGLHYHGRYQQLQESGEACRLPNYSANEVVPGAIYTMGVKMKYSGGRTSSDNVKGYGLTLSASDILKAATRAFAENPTVNTSSTGCILKLTDNQQKFSTVFVRREKGIRTFYPDATPDFNRNPYCVHPIVLTDSSEEADSVCGDNTGDGHILRAGRFEFRITESDENGFDMRVTECE